MRREKKNLIQLTTHTCSPYSPDQLGLGSSADENPISLMPFSLLLALLYSALCFGRSFASIIISSTVIDVEETSSSSAAEVRSSSSSFFHTPGRHLSRLWVLDVRFESEQNFNPFRSSLFCQKMASTHLKIFEDLENTPHSQKKSQTPGPCKATIIIADRSRRERAEIPPLLLLLAAVRGRRRRRLLLANQFHTKFSPTRNTQDFSIGKFDSSRNNDPVPIEKSTLSIRRCSPFSSFRPVVVVFLSLRKIGQRKKPLT